MTTLLWILAATIAGGVLSVIAAALLALNARASWVPVLVSYAVGTLLGKHKVNVKGMTVSPPVREDGLAMMVCTLENDVPPNVLKELEVIPDLYKARVARL